MKILRDKVPLVVDFGSRKIKLGQEFECEKHGRKDKITEDDVLNAASSVLPSCVVNGQRMTINKKYPDYEDYLQYAAPLAVVEHNFSQIGDPALSASTSITLSCGCIIPFSIRCGVEEVEEPKKIDALVRLGVNTENAHRWLSYIYKGEVDMKFGERKAREITAIIDAYKSEMPVLAKLKGQLRELIPPSVTGLDSRLFDHLASDIKAIEDELRTALKMVIDEISVPLRRLALRPEVLESKGWVARGR